MEQSKIPVPPHDDTLDAADKSTLIERVVRNYDLVRISPPPIPEELLNKPQKTHRARYSRKGDDAAEASSPTPARAAQPAPSAAAVVSERPEVVVPEVMVPAPAPVAASVPAPVAPVSNVPAVQASRFNGERLPVNRQHLREQGLIVPEGSVTALLEEFRIVKRTLLLQAPDLTKQGMGAAAQRDSDLLAASRRRQDLHGGQPRAVDCGGEGKRSAAGRCRLSPSHRCCPRWACPVGAGLMDALADPAIDVIDCVIGTDIPGLWVLPAGNATNSDSEFLTSARAQGGDRPA